MEDRILILAPRGRDAQIASELIQQSGFPCTTCVDLDNMVVELDAGTSAALITEEALAKGDRTGISDWLKSQPAWSDLPFVVLANGDRSPRSALASMRLEDLGNIVLLERPLHAEAMVGAIRSAVKARHRQYEIREFAATLERSVQERTIELEEARDTLEVALDAAGMGNWTLDVGSGEIESSPRYDQIFGYDEPQRGWNRERFLGHVDVADRVIVATALTAAAAQGEINLECSISTKDGSTRWIAVNGRVRRDLDGTPSRITGVVSDITARREADARLAQAQKMDAVGQLTGGVAHDFNNLLTPIVGSLDLLRRRLVDDERGQKLVMAALSAAERASTLTQRLLAFARRQTLQPSAVNISSLIDGITDLMRRSLGPTIEVVIDVPGDLSSARADPNQLELALLNLAINARDAMPGGGRLTVTAAEIDVEEGSIAALKAGRYIRVTATDTGTGMDEHTLAHAIEPFFSTKGVGKGTGLGLSMVHGLAAQSGGTLTISSVVGQGTSIAVWLPATSEAADTGSGQLSELKKPERTTKVLLVDDEELVRSATADMLRDIGYVVEEVNSGAQAIEILRSEHDIHAVVTDYLMPGMTGAQLINEVRQSGLSIPVLLITGYANTAEDVSDEVPKLPKPFRQVDLANRLAELIVEDAA